MIWAHKSELHESLGEQTRVHNPARQKNFASTLKEERTRLMGKRLAF